MIGRTNGYLSGFGIKDNIPYQLLNKECILMSIFNELENAKVKDFNIYFYNKEDTPTGDYFYFILRINDANIDEYNKHKLVRGINNTINVSPKYRNIIANYNLYNDIYDSLGKSNYVKIY